MAAERIGVLHPGEMGLSIAVAAQKGGHEVSWASEGRSAQTRERATKFGLHDAGTLAKLCENSQIIVSVCPPHAAEDVAQQVLAHRFAGVYLDANAIAPQRAVQIGETMGKGGAIFVDGGIIGGPAWTPGTTWLYLAGAGASRAAACFAAGPLEVRVLGESAGRASALKMCYAAHSKGATALLCAALAAAERLGVRPEFQERWDHDEREGAAKKATQRLRRVPDKAWRFVGELEEIAATFHAAGLPQGFHAAAADVYHRLARFKDAPAVPAIEEVLAALLQSGGAANPRSPGPA
jgi:3-hydroxyisobutyrate dehydrogenase-like beta-hydroxyacid dehydrogenase